jgi:hypothetical protein
MMHTGRRWRRDTSAVAIEGSRGDLEGASVSSRSKTTAFVVCGI